MDQLNLQGKTVSGTSLKRAPAECPHCGHKPLERLFMKDDLYSGMRGVYQTGCGKCSHTVYFCNHGVSGFNTDPWKTAPCKEKHVPFR